MATRPTKRVPAPPFTTSTLQQEAARKLGFPVALTMRVAQALYESGRITYMRTDSMNLSNLCLSSCAPVIEQLMGSGYHKRRTYHTHSKGAQEAHEAIRPTDMACTSITGTAQEKRLYDLIWRRTIACQMEDALLEKTTVTIAPEGRSERFTATGEVVRFEGFLKVYRESVNDDDAHAAEATEGKILPATTEGQVLPCHSMTAQQRFTAQPPRYTEASLVHKLEELGIGRPSPYAPTIPTIQQREYVAKGDKEGPPRHYREVNLTDGRITTADKQENVGSERGKLIPTDTGTVVNDFLLQYFPEILDYHFSARVEKDFDAVAEGEMEWTGLISRFYHNFEPRVEATLNEKTDHRVGERELGTDPATGKPVLVKIGRFGPVAQIGLASQDEKPRFANLAQGQSIETITLDEALELFKLPRTLGEYEGLPVQVNTGRFGPYVLHNKKFTSVPKNVDPMDVTLDDAIALIQAKRQAEAQSLLCTFAEEPDMEVRNGRFGPYIAYKGKNYKIPKDRADQAASLTLEECRQLVEADAKRTTRARRTTKK